jgi:hypothetical protein
MFQGDRSPLSSLLIPNTEEPGQYERTSDPRTIAEALATTNRLSLKASFASPFVSGNLAVLGKDGFTNEVEEILTGTSALGETEAQKEFLQNFVGVIDGAIAVRVGGEPNPENVEIICEIAKQVGLAIKPCEDLLDAIYYLSKISGDEACRIIICGSLHLARDVRKISTTKFK